jgi:hypothetical protein
MSGTARSSNPTVTVSAIIRRRRVLFSSSTTRSPLCPTCPVDRRERRWGTWNIPAGNSAKMAGLEYTPGWTRDAMTSARRADERAGAILGFPSGATVLDVGCGAGTII